MRDGDTVSTNRAFAAREQLVGARRGIICRPVPIWMSTCISAFIAESSFIPEEEVAVPGKEIGLWVHSVSEEGE